MIATRRRRPEAELAASSCRKAMLSSPVEGTELQTLWPSGSHRVSLLLSGRMKLLTFTDRGGSLREMIDIQEVRSDEFEFGFCNEMQAYQSILACREYDQCSRMRGAISLWTGGPCGVIPVKIDYRTKWW